jgi:hypothetical protein
MTNRIGQYLLDPSEVQSMSRRVAPDWTVDVVDYPHPHTTFLVGGRKARRATMFIPLWPDTLATTLKSVEQVGGGVGRAMCLFLAAHELGHVVARDSDGSRTTVKRSPLEAFIHNVVEDGWIDGYWVRMEFPAFAQFNRLIAAGMLANPTENLDEMVGDGTDPVAMARALLMGAIFLLNANEFPGKHGSTRHFDHPRAEELWQALAPLIDETMSEQASDPVERERIAKEIYQLLLGVLEDGRQVQEGQDPIGQGTSDSDRQDQPEQGLDPGSVRPDRNGNAQIEPSIEGQDPIGQAGDGGQSGEEPVDFEQELVEALGLGSDQISFHGCASAGCGFAEMPADVDWSRIGELVGLGEEIDALQEQIERRCSQSKATTRLAETGQPGSYRESLDISWADLSIFGADLAELEADMAHRLRRVISPLLGRKDLQRLGAQVGKGLSLQYPVDVGMACASVSGRRIWRAPVREVSRYDGLDVVVVLDVSGSMSSLTEAGTLLVHAAAATVGLCRAAATWPTVRLGVICFGTRGEMVLDLGSGGGREARLRAGIAAAASALGGGTVLAPALRWAGAVLDGREDASRRAVIILITDADLLPSDHRACQDVHEELAAAELPVIGIALGASNVSTLASICDGLVDLRMDASKTEAHLRKVLYRLISTSKPKVGVV